MQKKIAGYILQEKLASYKDEIEHWKANRGEEIAEVYLVSPSLRFFIENLPDKGCFAPFDVVEFGARLAVIVPGGLRLSGEDILGKLGVDAGACFAWHISSYLGELHNSGQAHGFLHASQIGIDLSGKFVIRPAIGNFIVSDPDESASAIATDCWQLGFILKELGISSKTDSRCSLLIAGLQQEISRLRLQPAAAVRQSLTAVIARHPEWEERFVSVLGKEWVLEQQARAEDSLIPRRAPRREIKKEVFSDLNLWGNMFDVSSETENSSGQTLIREAFQQQDKRDISLFQIDSVIFSDDSEPEESNAAKSAKIQINLLQGMGSLNEKNPVFEQEESSDEDIESSEEDTEGDEPVLQVFLTGSTFPKEAKKEVKIALEESEESIDIETTVEFVSGSASSEKSIASLEILIDDKDAAAEELLLELEEIAQVEIVVEPVQPQIDEAPEVNEEEVEDIALSSEHIEEETIVVEEKSEEELKESLVEAVSEAELALEELPAEGADTDVVEETVRIDKFEEEAVELISIEEEEPEVTKISIEIPLDEELEESSSEELQGVENYGLEEFEGFVESLNSKDDVEVAVVSLDVEEPLANIRLPSIEEVREEGDIGGSVEALFLEDSPKVFFPTSNNSNEFAEPKWADALGVIDEDDHENALGDENYTGTKVEIFGDVDEMFDDSAREEEELTRMAEKGSPWGLVLVIGLVVVFGLVAFLKPTKEVEVTEADVTVGTETMGGVVVEEVIDFSTNPPGGTVYVERKKQGVEPILLTLEPEKQLYEICVDWGTNPICRRVSQKELKGGYTFEQ